MYINIVFFLVLSLSLHGQKRVSRVFEADNIQSIVLESDEVYKIRMRTAPVKDITIVTRSDGEYFNQIQLEAEVKDQTLYLKSRFPEILRSGYDKLSAHKVFSMEIELIIPDRMQILIRSNLASVFMEGLYRNVSIELRSGSSFLNNFEGNAVINTYDGNIVIHTADSCTVKATSRHGVVSIPELSEGANQLRLTSINGDIKVQETK